MDNSIGIGENNTEDIVGNETEDQEVGRKTNELLQAVEIAKKDPENVEKYVSVKNKREDLLKLTDALDQQKTVTQQEPLANNENIGNLQDIVSRFKNTRPVISEEPVVEPKKDVISAMTLEKPANQSIADKEMTNPEKKVQESNTESVPDTQGLGEQQTDDVVSEPNETPTGQDILKGDTPSIKELLARIQASRVQESNDIDDAASRSNTTRALLGMLKGASKMASANIGGSLVNVKADTSMQDQLMKLSEQDYQNEIKRIRGRTKNLAKSVSDISTQTKLNEIDPESNISQQARIIFASKVGPIRMKDLEAKGIDLDKLSYKKLLKFNNLLMSGELTPAQLEKIESKEKISAMKTKKADTKISRKEKRADEKELRGLGEKLTGTKRGGMLKKQWAGLNDIESMRNKLRSAMMPGHKFNAQDAKDLSAAWSKIITGGVPAQSLIQETIPTSYRTQMAEIANWGDADEVKMNYYTPGMLQHMNSQLSIMDETRNWAIARTLKNASNTFSRLFDENPEEKKRHLKQFKKYLAWDNENHQFVNKHEHIAEKYKLVADEAAKRHGIVQEGKVKITNGSKILIIPLERLSEAEKDGFRRME